MTIQIPVTYDGEDLNDVAESLGWSVEELIRRHTEATYTVAFTGFALGFAYMTSDDPAFDVPRRKSSRVRIPAGSVALGGKFGGIYPSDSPGGWQLLGRTPLKMWDTGRSRAALLAPGDRVRFRDMAKGASVSVSAMPAASEASIPASSNAEGLLVTRGDRPAHRGELMCRQSARLGSHRDRLWWLRHQGRPAGDAGGHGAPTPMTIQTVERRSFGAPIDQPFALDAGDELTLEFPPEGTRSYLAIRGGFAVEEVLNSAATDTLAKVGVDLGLQLRNKTPKRRVKAKQSMYPSWCSRISTSQSSKALPWP
ncbi:carboxyltransferase domain-containing protein [Rhizobium mongolense]|uniref:5-oxoprolinase subunit B family protein n=1 Tax=Rhizobium mongolense TaxID=57676 RepID=UPI003F645ABD